MSKSTVSHADMVAVTKCQAYIRGFLWSKRLKQMSMSLWILHFLNIALHPLEIDAPIRENIAKEIHKTEVNYVDSLIHVVEVNCHLNPFLHTKSH